MEQKLFQHEKIGVGKAQKLVHASRRLQGPRGYRRLPARKGWKVESLLLGSGTAGLDEGDGPLHVMHGSVRAELEVQRTIKWITKEFLMDHGEEKESATSQEREMPVYGSKFVENCIIWQNGAFGWKWNM